LFSNVLGALSDDWMACSLMVALDMVIGWLVGRE
jgi:hypothetical protein